MSDFQSDLMGKANSALEGVLLPFWGGDSLFASVSAG